MIKTNIQRLQIWLKDWEKDKATMKVKTLFASYSMRKKNSTGLHIIDLIDYNMKRGCCFFYDRW